MPRKVRNLVADLVKAGFTYDPERGKGSHMLGGHPTGVQILLSGNMGDDAHPLAEKNVREMIKEAERRTGGQ
jgi:predicted RNA binding protein YcfA (HicA-like mRNA interferase family)